MKKILFIISISFFLSGVSHAQLGGLMRKAQRQAERSLNTRMEKEIEKKVDEEVNKQVDKALDEAEKQDTLTQQERDEAARVREERIENLAKSYGVGVDVAHKDVYSFSAKMDMLVEGTTASGRKEEEVMYYSFFDKESADYAIQFEDDDKDLSYFIFDFDNKCSLILSTDGDDKSGIATNIKEDDLEKWVDESDYEDVPNGKLKKTGKTKTISGFKCEEYSAEDEEGIVNMWVTKELKNKINRGMYRSSVFGGSFLLAGQTDGVMIQYDYKSKTSKEQNLMTVKKVSFDSGNKIDVTPYQIVGFRVPR